MGSEVTARCCYNVCWVCVYLLKCLSRLSILQSSCWFPCCWVVWFLEYFEETSPSLHFAYCILALTICNPMSSHSPVFRLLSKEAFVQTKVMTLPDISFHGPHSSRSHMYAFPPLRFIVICVWGEIKVEFRSLFLMWRPSYLSVPSPTQ